jgi:SAM-dependent methyltransferase
MATNKCKIKANFADIQAYEKRIRKFVPYYERMMDYVLECMPESNQKYSILELGCGTGNLTFRVLKKARAAELVAIDIVREMVEACGNRLKKERLNAELICADMVEFCRGNSFDYVFSNLALHYPETEEEKFLTCRNVFESLKPGGLFSFSVMLSDHSKEISQKIWKRWEKDVLANEGSQEEIDEWYRTAHLTDHPMTAKRWLSLLGEVGFSNYDLLWRETIFGIIWAEVPKEKLKR